MEVLNLQRLKRTTLILTTVVLPTICGRYLSSNFRLSAPTRCSSSVYLLYVQWSVPRRPPNAAFRRRLRAPACACVRLRLPACVTEGASGASDPTRFMCQQKCAVVCSFSFSSPGGICRRAARRRAHTSGSAPPPLPRPPRFLKAHRP